MSARLGKSGVIACVLGVVFLSGLIVSFSLGMMVLEAFLLAAGANLICAAGGAVVLCSHERDGYLLIANTVVAGIARLLLAAVGSIAILWVFRPHQLWFIVWMVCTYFVLMVVEAFLIVHRMETVTFFESELGSC